jgi:hypothetical protein
VQILALWVVKYESGSTSERFIKALNKLGHTVKVIPIEDGNVEANLIKESLSGDYDVLIHVPYIIPFRYEIIKSLPFTTVAWMGDDEWWWDKYQDLCKLVEDSHDFCVTTDSESLYRYRNGLLGSWGYGEEWKPKKVEKDIDIYFCGSHTGMRGAYIDALKDSGLKVTAHGKGFSGKIDQKTMINNYRRAKIGLSFISEYKDFYYQQIKARTFEIPAVGTFQLSEHSDKLSKLFTIGKDLDTFKNVKELTEKCLYYLKNFEEREMMAYRGHLSNKPNSYKQIFKRIFNQIEEAHEKA